MFQYQLISFEAIDPPLSDKQGDWYQYVIANKFNRITGYRSGKREEVKDYIHMVMDYQNKKLFINTGNFEKQNYGAESESFV